ncbi:MAG: 2'-phosphotransferase [Verrucomicrobia bacterium]|jgi:putative RNA 2'-phosphotransferase|nr:2'-phosphotransferase [Verrucomicrobiota bacterium]
MNPKELTKLSKFLSLVLRHEPERIGITLDNAGWVPVIELIAACQKHGKSLTVTSLEEIVATSDKKRFAFSDDGQRIRANQGHSVGVDLGLTPVPPPEILYHGTVEKFLPSIRSEGLRKGERHHVHLSKDETTAIKVGERRGQAIILKIAAGRMHAEGHPFFLSANGVWLTDHVPPDYIL